MLAGNPLDENPMHQKTLSEREKELRTLLGTKEGRAELEELASASVEASDGGTLALGS